MGSKVKIQRKSFSTAFKCALLGQNNNNLSQQLPNWTWYHLPSILSGHSKCFIIVGQITTETGRKDLNLCGHYSMLINLYATESGKIASCQHILTGLFFLIQTLHKPVSKIQWAHWFNNGAKLTWKGFSPVWTSWCLLSFELSTKACMISPWKTKPNLDNDDTSVENNNNIYVIIKAVIKGWQVGLPPPFRIVTPQLLL